MSDDLFAEPDVALTPMQLSEHVAEDHFATSLSLKGHPVQFFRERLTQLGAITNAAHRRENLKQNARVTVAGISLMRQMPMTAKGTVFMTLEDETDIANIIVWKHVFARHRRTVMTARFVAVRGRLQRAGLVVHVLAEDFIDLTPEMRRLQDDDFTASVLLRGSADAAALPLPKSRDFH
jgi:error-prone DNA polymerase